MRTRCKLGCLRPRSAAHPGPACSVSKSSCTGAQRAGCAQGTAPSALPRSTAVIGCFSHRPDASTCHSRRRQPAQAGRGAPPEALNTRRWPAVMTPRLIGQPADGAVASHRAAGGADPSIEGPRSEVCWRHQQGSCGPFPARLGPSLCLLPSFVEVQFRTFIGQHALLQEKPRTPSHSIRLLGWPLIAVPGAVQPVVPLCRGRVVVASI
jgi:hypothetical protein